MVSEVSPIIRIGESAGLIFRQFGFCGRLVGNWPRAALMAACTSRAEASILRLRSNCMVMLQLPSELDDVISFRPAMRPNWRSKGVTTKDAKAWGPGPGSAGWPTSGGIRLQAEARQAGQSRQCLHPDQV